MKKKIISIVSWSRANVALFGLLLGLAGFGSLAFKASAQRSSSDDPKAQQRTNTEKVETIEYSTIELPPDMVQGLNRNQPDAGRVNAPAGVGFTAESEPNGTSATASPIAGSQAVVRAPLFPNGDIDFYSFTANAGDRIYVAAMTSFSAGSSTDSQVTVLASDGTTTLEFDDDNGSFAGLSSSIAGVTIPSNGTYYLKVNDFTAGTTSERPYELYFRKQTAAPTAEIEANDTPATANPLPSSGHVSGSRNPALATEQDWYSLNLNAGDTVMLSLDLDPERDLVTWNGRLGFALFGDAGNQILAVDDSGAGDVAPNPNRPSEALFMTVKTAGTYYAFVDSALAAVGGPTSTYNLSVTVFPATQEGVNCTTYTSTNVPQTIGPGTGLVSSTITVPGNPIIADLDVDIQLNHALMLDIDAHLRSPSGNDNGLFTDIGSAATGGQTIMDVVIDDEAGLPPAFTALKGTQIKPELNYRLGWFDGENAGGTWTLDLRDDTAGTNGGTLTGWALKICEAPPAPSCPVGYAPVTVVSTDFESGAAGFTHSGTQDEWELGLPATAATNTANPVAAFNSCSSGVNCWKTDLDNTYNVSSNQDLLSPNVNLSGMVAPIIVNWSQRYQMESASFDHMFVDAQQVGGATPVRLFEWLDATMVNAPGNPAVNVPAASGWSRMSRRADSLAGLNSEVRFHLDSDTTVQLGGLAIDDFSVTGCQLVAVVPPVVSGTKTVSTTGAVGSPVAYTIVLNNTGAGPQGDNPGNEFTDVLPSNVTLVSATATSGTAVATIGTNTVTWNGAIPAAGSVTITINATINAGTAGQTASNQGSISWDADGNGSNDTTTPTDNPAIGGGTDPTDFVIGLSSTTTTITSDNPDPSAVGQLYTVVVAVVPVPPAVLVPTGTVTVSDGSGSTCTITLPATSCGLASSASGPKTITATYAGDANYNGSSDTEAHTVIKANTTTTIVSDTPDPSVVGQNYTVTASVTVSAPGSGAPTGNLTLSDGTSSCVAILPATSCQLTSSTAGAKTLTATYSGNANFNGSVSATASHTVNKADTATGIQVSINAPNYGSTLTATATITAVAPGGGVPQGTVNFNDGGFAIAACQNVPVSALGSAVCSTTQLPAGTNKVIQAVYSGNANYNGSNGSATQTIGKAPLNVTASSHTVTYGDAAPTVTSTITGFVLGESAANLGTQPSCSTTYTQGSPVSGSQYPTTCSGGVSGNYSFNYINGTVTVNKRALTVTADNKSRGYGAANPALTATLSGFIGSDNAANSTTGTAGLSTTATATSPVGNYPITATIGTLASGNYSFTTFTNGTLSVTAVQLTVTANNQTRVYGAPNPTLTYSITGFVNGEGVGVLTGTPSITTAANATSAPGTYPITAAVGTLANPNYTFTTANGTLTVTQASTTTTITNAAALGNPTSAGQSYAVNWTTSPVAPATGTPTGNVTVSDGTQTCTAAVAAGTCSLTSTTSGTKTITATYAGDTNFAGSTSQPVQHNVIVGLTGNVKQFVAFGTNTNLAGVTITLTNTTTSQSTTTTTDANGNYSFINVTLGQNFSITPSGLGKVYEATSRTYNNAVGNIAGADFLAYDIVGPNTIPRSARVQSQIATQGQPVTVPILFTATGVETKVSFSVEYPANALGIPTATCGTGTVNCTVTIDNSLAGKAGITITPAAPLTAGTREIVKITFPTFTSPATSAAIRFGDFPQAKDVRNAENNALPTLYWTDGLISFTGGTLLDGASISGKVTTAAGQGLRNATVTLLDTAGGKRTTVTSSFGNYTFENLDTGRDYMLIVTSKRYRFASRLVNLTGNLNDVNLVGLE